MKLYLDDYRPCPFGYHLALNVKEAIDLVMKCDEYGLEWEAASLDHDLCDEHYEAHPRYNPDSVILTGLGFVVWMIVTNHWPRIKPVVHSFNPTGKQKMEALINEFGPYDEKGVRR